jgi:hypothetical protein
MASVAEIKDEVLSQPGRFTKITDNLHAKEVVIGDGERRRRYILCFTPKEAERQRAHRDEIVRLLEEELASHPDRDASAQWAIELLASKRYKRYLTTTEAANSDWTAPPSPRPDATTANGCLKPMTTPSEKFRQ